MGKIAEPLQKAYQYNRWKAVLESHYRSTRQLFDGTFVITDGTRIAERLNAENEMKEVLIRSLSDKYAFYILSLKRFTQMWERLESVINGENNTHIQTLMMKMETMR